MHSMQPMTLDEIATAPVRVSGAGWLDAAPQAVFAELADPSLWFPLMRRSVWHTGATSGVGAEREIRNTVLGAFRERMLVWDPGERVAFTMLATTSPFIARAIEDWRLVPERGGTHVEWVVAAHPTTLGRAAMPILRSTTRALFARGLRTLGKRAAAYPRGKQAV
jgi:polyketide cyclase/dehydrase/lipid transport protein